MKKLFKFGFVAVAAAMVLGFASCGNESDGETGNGTTTLTPTEHTHTFAAEWTSDGTHHWHAATCEHTTEVSGKAEHSWSGGELAIICSVCKRAEIIVDAIQGEGPYDVKITGEITEATITSIATALKGLEGDQKVNLDLSETTGLTELADEAFFYCSSLASVTIPNSVTSIGDSAFYQCTSLTSVTVKAETPPTLKLYREVYYEGEEDEEVEEIGAFDVNAEGRKIYVPKGAGAAYKAAENWSFYADDIVELEE